MKRMFQAGKTKTWVIRVRKIPQLAGIGPHLLLSLSRQRREMRYGQTIPYVLGPETDDCESLLYLAPPDVPRGV